MLVPCGTHAAHTQVMKIRNACEQGKGGMTLMWGGGCRGLCASWGVQPTDGRKRLCGACASVSMLTPCARARYIALYVPTATLCVQYRCGVGLVTQCI